MNDDLRVQYENYPYPPRDPADEARRLVSGSPSHILEIDHHIYAGKRQKTGIFRALVAGGGTGDATVMLAQQHASAGIEAEIVHLDISEASTAIARARVEARGLTNVTFLHGPIEALPALEQAPFDYIDCCGVLHHLADPAIGLAALAGALTPGGGMGIMVYAPLGRTGVYHAQSMLRMIAGDDADPDRIETARKLLTDLPETNWLRRNPHVGDHIDQGDAGLYDLLLHRRDRAYTVLELAALLSGGGMRPVAFADPARYEPGVYLTEKSLAEKARALPWLERCAFAELLAGNMKTHIVYAVRADNPDNTLAAPDSPAAVPVLRDADDTALAAQLKPGMSLNVTADGLKLSLPLPPLAGPILSRVDGKRSLDAIHRDLADRIGPDGPPLDWIAFKTQFDQLYGVFYGLNRMFIRKPAG